MHAILFCSHFAVQSILCIDNNIDDNELDHCVCDSHTVLTNSITCLVGILQESMC